VCVFVDMCCVLFLSGCISVYTCIKSTNFECNCGSVIQSVHLENFTAANWESFDFNVSYSSF